jgi:hypothetical protein
MPKGPDDEVSRRNISLGADCDSILFLFRYRNDALQARIVLYRAAVVLTRLIRTINSSLPNQADKGVQQVNEGSCCAFSRLERETGLLEI